MFNDTFIYFHRNSGIKLQELTEENEVALQDEERVSLLQAVDGQQYAPPDAKVLINATANDNMISLAEIRRREGSLRDIECGVTEINQMLKHISTMVNEHQDYIGISE